MASELSLSWEWPDERLPDHKLAVKVDWLKPHSLGFLGIRKSPSFATTLPDPMELGGTIVAGRPSLIGTRVKVVLPKLELGSISTDDIVAIGVLDTGISICLELIPATENETSSWLDQWLCPLKD